MIKRTKILLTEIRADKNAAENLKEAAGIYATACYRYGLQMLAMNTFSMLETMEDTAEDKREPFREIRTLLTNAFIEFSDGAEEMLEKKRDALLREMHALSGLTDAFGCYEYILNRMEPEVTGSAADEDPQAIADAAFRFAFADKDKFVTNTRIQSIIAELPVRMSKDRFFDIIGNSLMLYKGGDISAANDFADALREVFTGADSPAFAEYPELKGTLLELKKVCDAEPNQENYETATGLLSAATLFLQDSVSRNMLLTEVVNNAILTVLTRKDILPELLTEKDTLAEDILKKSLLSSDIYQDAEEIDLLFADLEGVQEEYFETLSRLNILADEWKSFAGDVPELTPVLERLAKAELFTSSSLYMDLNQDFTVVTDEAGEEDIRALQETLRNEISAALQTMSKKEKRSCMARALSMLPVFFNTKEEIREYFVGALSACRDRGELTAIKNILDMMVDMESMN